LILLFSAKIDMVDKIGYEKTHTTILFLLYS